MSDDPWSGPEEPGEGAAGGEDGEPGTAGGAAGPATSSDALAGEEGTAGASEAEGDAGGFDELVAQLDAEVAASTAGAPAVEAVPVPARRHVVFRLGGARFAVPIERVVELAGRLPATPVPNVPDWLLGVTNLRGEILSLVDLAGFFGLDAGDRRHGERILVVRGPGGEAIAGLVVDQVLGQRGLAADEVLPTAAPLASPVAGYLAGVVERDGEVLGVVDLDRLLTSPQFRQFEAT